MKKGIMFALLFLAGGASILTLHGRNWGTKYSTGYVSPDTQKCYKQCEATYKKCSRQFPDSEAACKAHKENCERICRGEPPATI